MTITGVLWFEGRLDGDRLREVVADRLVGRYPAFGRRVSPGRWPRTARWSRAAPDLRHHVRESSLPGAQDRDVALRAEVARLISEPLDLARPPWQLHLLHHADGSSVLVARVHHCLADGIALSRVLLSLTDPVEPVEPATLLEPVGRPPAAAVSRGARAVGRAAATAVRLLLLPREPVTPLRGTLGRAKHAAWSAPRDLAAVRDAGRGAGATLNDLLLAATAGALRSSLLERGVVDPPDLRVFVPVDLRGGARVDPAVLGNRFGLLPVLLPVSRPDPRERLAAVVRATDRRSAARQAAATFVLVGLLAVLPRWLHHRVVAVLGGKVTAVVTNVPGPRTPVALAGTRLGGLVFWVPQTSSVGLGVSIFSYAGQVRVGVAADAGLVPDPQALVDALDAELDLLTAAPRSR